MDTTAGRTLSMTDSMLAVPLSSAGPAEICRIVTVPSPDPRSRRRCRRRSPRRAGLRPARPPPRATRSHPPGRRAPADATAGGWRSGDHGSLAASGRAGGCSGAGSEPLDSARVGSRHSGGRNVSPSGDGALAGSVSERAPSGSTGCHTD